MNQTFDRKLLSDARNGAVAVSLKSHSPLDPQRLSFGVSTPFHLDPVFLHPPVLLLSAAGANQPRSFQATVPSVS